MVLKNSALVYLLTGVTCSDCDNDLIYVLTEAYIHTFTYTFALYPNNYEPSAFLNISQPFKYPTFEWHKN